MSRTGKRVLAAVLVVAAIMWLPLNKSVERLGLRLWR